MKISYVGSLFSMVVLLSAVAINANPQPSGSAISILSAPVTISQPGTYRLATDVTGAITIAASNVELNLDNRKIMSMTDGVIINNQSEVLIKNGIIEGGVNGINVSTCQNIEISDVDFIDNGTGLNILTVTAIQVDNCHFRGYTSAALWIDDTNNGQFSNAMMNFNGNSERVVLAQNSANLIFQKLFMNNNRREVVDNIAELTVFDLNTCRDCLVKKCQANENMTVGFSGLGRLIAFRSQLGFKNSFELCQAQNNDVGGLDLGNGLFTFDQEEGSQILNSSFKQNPGFIRLIELDTVTNCLIKGNNVIDNISGISGVGILFDGIVTNCVIEGNTISNNSSAGILFDDTDSINNCVIEDNTISNNDGNGISFNLSSTNCVVKDNLLTSNSGNGIGASTAVNLLVQGNSAIGNDDDGITVVGSGCVVKDNCASENGTNGIAVFETGGGASVTNAIVGNYSGRNSTNYVPTTIPLLTLTISTGALVNLTVPGDMTRWHNISGV